MHKPYSILVTAGPTREYIDPVRFLSNPSTGQMGFALAKAAKQRRASVTLIHGPVTLLPPTGVKCIDVVSAAEMATATLKAAKQADLIIMTAAVSDYRPIHQTRQKIKKQAEHLTLELERTQDILATLGEQKRDGQILVGFAAETHAILKHARDKLIRKNLDWIVVNQVKPGNAFESLTNQATLLGRDGSKQVLPRMSKQQLAKHLLRRIWPK